MTLDIVLYSAVGLIMTAVVFITRYEMRARNVCLWHSWVEDFNEKGERCRTCQQCKVYEEWGIWEGSWTRISRIDQRVNDVVAERRREESYLDEVRIAEWRTPAPIYIAKAKLWEDRKRDRLIGEEL